MKKLLKHKLAFLTEHHALSKAVIDFQTCVDHPMLLVSQVQRSGGTLLSQLFDGHPELHAHPHELKIGRPDKTDWPQLNLADQRKLFDMVWEENTEFFLKNGYRKDIKGRKEKELFRALFLPSLMRSIFNKSLAAKSSGQLTQRQVLNAYFTAYFNGWVDNRNLWGEKKYVAAFVPSLSSKTASVSRFWTDYPDGKLIFLTRDPCSWYASATKYDAKKFSGLDQGFNEWMTSSESILEWRQKMPDQTMLYRFEDLVSRTEAVMRSICRHTGLTFCPALLEPTFNGRPIRASSSFTVENISHGVIAEAANRRQTLEPVIIEQIEQKSSALAGRLNAVLTEL
ncbi:MAG: sulfotransferase [Verrucomicrobiaceae bacterium]